MVNAGGTPARRSSGGGGIRRRRTRTRGRKRARSGGGGGGSHGIQRSMQGVAIGGLAFGLLVKNFPTLPRIPGIGRSGTVALAIYLLKPQNKILQDMGIAAAAIAGYSFGETGTVSGDDDVLSSQG